MQVGGGYSSFLMPFDTTLWVLLLATLVFTSLLLFLVDHISRKARLKAFGQIHGLARLQERRKRGEKKISPAFTGAALSGLSDRRRQLVRGLGALLTGFADGGVFVGGEPPPPGVDPEATRSNLATVDLNIARLATRCV